MTALTSLPCFGTGLARLQQVQRASVAKTWMSRSNKDDQPTGEGIGNPVQTMNSREAQMPENPVTYSSFLPWISLPHFGLPISAYVVSISHLDIFITFTERLFLFIFTRLFWLILKWKQLCCRSWRTEHCCSQGNVLFPWVQQDASEQNLQISDVFLIWHNITLCFPNTLPHATLLPSPSRLQCSTSCEFLSFAVFLILTVGMRSHEAGTWQTDHGVSK